MWLSFDRHLNLPYKNRLGRRFRFRSDRFVSFCVALPLLWFGNGSCLWPTCDVSHGRTASSTSPHCHTPLPTTPHATVLTCRGQGQKQRCGAEAGVGRAADVGAGDKDGEPQGQRQRWRGRWGDQGGRGDGGTRGFCLRSKKLKGFSRGLEGRRL